MDLQQFLQNMSQADGVSGYEDNVAELIIEAFSPFVDDIKRDQLGNTIFLKKGMREEAPRVLLCAHMDEIGLMITKIEENGFLRFTTLGGFDTRTLPGQEVTVYGREPVQGIIGVKPPFLRREEDKTKTFELESLFIDTGLTGEEAFNRIKVGSVAALKRECLHLRHERYAGKAMDDRAGVALLWLALQELNKINHDAHVYAVATVQEEVGVRGAIVSTYGIAPDLGVAVDVSHGDFPGAAEHEVSTMGKGVAVASGPNVHPYLEKKLTDMAEEYSLPYQRELSPGPTGTDAHAIQVSQEGIPTALLSIPLRYMHTSVEVADFTDIKLGGKLLAFFVSSLDNAFVEGLSCL